MTFRHILILFSVLGISSTFMPWIHYPKMNVAIYGYLVDGILTGLYFLISLIFASYVLYKKKLNTIISLALILVGLFLAYSSIIRLDDLNNEKINFRSDNPLISSGTAGFHEGIGIYVYGIAAAGLSLTLILGLILKHFQTDTATLKIKKYLMVGLVCVAVVIGAVALFKIMIPSDKLSKSSLTPIISGHVRSMGDALKNGNYTLFLDYNHPGIIQSNGGRAKAIEMLQETNKALLENNTKIVSVLLKDVHDIKINGENIQVIITQEVLFDNNGKSINELQKMLAVSDDSGKSWQFININNKTKTEVLEFFPSLNEHLSL